MILLILIFRFFLSQTGNIFIMVFQSQTVLFFCIFTAWRGITRLVKKKMTTHAIFGHLPILSMKAIYLFNIFYLYLYTKAHWDQGFNGPLFTMHNHTHKSIIINIILYSKHKYLNFIINTSYTFNTQCY